VHRLVVCPDGAVAALPFGALPLSSTGVLLDKYTIVAIPRVGISAAATGDGADGMMLVGDIRYTEQQSLPGTSKEIAAIKQAAAKAGVKCETLAGDDATASQLLDRANRFRYVHLATHGGFLAAIKDATRGSSYSGERTSTFTRNPFLLAGVYLAHDPADSNFLSAQLISHQDLPAKLVVLSACETALGDSARGQGVFGLQQAFHLAGVDETVGSLWRVDDTTTEQFMTHFYQNLWTQSLSAPEALRSAQLQMRDAGFATSDWSAFTCSIRAIPGSMPE
jgi:CHAT domain-containing protein